MPEPGNVVKSVWKDQAVWSAVANLLKKKITQARSWALILGIVGATLATLAAQVTRDSGEPMQVAGADVSFVLSVISALALAAVTVLGYGFSAKRVENWIRARSVSEALKHEVFLYLTLAKPYDENDKDATLARRTDEITAKAKDLAVVASTVSAKEKPLPNIAKPEDYIERRVTAQIEEYYLPMAKELGLRLKLFQTCAVILTGSAALLSALAGFCRSDAIGVWVAVATTIAGAVVAHTAAAKYQFNVISYFSTARQLRSLRDRFLDDQRKGTATREAYDEFVRACEEVISIENQGWMADWRKSDESTPTNVAAAPL